MNIDRDDPSASEEQQEPPSKSARKREMQALQDLGARLTELSPTELRHIPVPEELAQAVEMARRLHQREARRRQLQYIGKLMRRIDAAPIESAMLELEQGRQSQARRFQQLEELRDAILAGGDAAIEAVMTRHPHADRQHLRQLQRQALREAQAQRPPAGARKLFRYLRELDERDSA